MNAVMTADQVLDADRAPVDVAADVPAERRPARARTGLGPLLAVAGLCGGAGATTLAYLVARSAARHAGRPVLVCDTGGPAGGLASYARVRAPRSLPRVANAISAHEPLADGLFADDGSGLRVMASRPELDLEADPAGLERLLHDARERHALTVVDCGTLRGPTDRMALDAATHVAWVLPASAGGIARGAGVLDLFEVNASRGELLVARRESTTTKPPIRSLTELAAGRRAPLVLMPQVAELAQRPISKALAAAALTLDAIESRLRA
jgi:Flp pilus assembly CpaE family ATPase